MKVHNVGFENYIELKKLLTEAQPGPYVPGRGRFTTPNTRVNKRLDFVRNDDKHKFEVLMDEIEKSGLEYALTSYYGESEALRLIMNFVSEAAALAARDYLEAKRDLTRLLKPHQRQY